MQSGFRFHTQLILTRRKSLSVSEIHRQLGLHFAIGSLNVDVLI